MVAAAPSSWSPTSPAAVELAAASSTPLPCYALPDAAAATQGTAAIAAPCPRTDAAIPPAIRTVLRGNSEASLPPAVFPPSCELTGGFHNLTPLPRQQSYLTLTHAAGTPVLHAIAAGCRASAEAAFQQPARASLWWKKGEEEARPSQHLTSWRAGEPQPGITQKRTMAAAAAPAQHALRSAAAVPPARSAEGDPLPVITANSAKAAGLAAFFPATGSTHSQRSIAAPLEAEVFAAPKQQQLADHSLLADFVSEEAAISAARQKLQQLRHVELLQRQQKLQKRLSVLQEQERQREEKAAAAGPGGWSSCHWISTASDAAADDVGDFNLFEVNVSTSASTRPDCCIDNSYSCGLKTSEEQSPQRRRQLLGAAAAALDSSAGHLRLHSPAVPADARAGGTAGGTAVTQNKAEARKIFALQEDRPAELFTTRQEGPQVVASGFAAASSATAHCRAACKTVISASVAALSPAAGAVAAADDAAAAAPPVCSRRDSYSLLFPYSLWYEGENVEGIGEKQAETEVAAAFTPAESGSVNEKREIAVSAPPHATGARAPPSSTCSYNGKQIRYPFPEAAVLWESSISCCSDRVFAAFDSNIKRAEPRRSAPLLQQHLCAAQPRQQQGAEEQQQQEVRPATCASLPQPHVEVQEPPGELSAKRSNDATVAQWLSSWSSPAAPGGLAKSEREGKGGAAATAAVAAPAASVSNDAAACCVQKRREGSCTSSEEKGIFDEEVGRTTTVFAAKKNSTAAPDAGNGAATTAATVSAGCTAAAPSGGETLRRTAAAASVARDSAAITKKVAHVAAKAKSKKACGLPEGSRGVEQRPGAAVAAAEKGEKENWQLPPVDSPRQTIVPLHRHWVQQLLLQQKKQRQRLLRLQQQQQQKLHQQRRRGQRDRPSVQQQQQRGQQQQPTAKHQQQLPTRQQRLNKQQERTSTHTEEQWQQGKHTAVLEAGGALAAASLPGKKLATRGKPSATRLLQRDLRTASPRASAVLAANESTHGGGTFNPARTAAVTLLPAAAAAAAAPAVVTWGASFAAVDVERAAPPLPFPLHAVLVSSSVAAAPVNVPPPAPAPTKARAVGRAVPLAAPAGQGGCLSVAVAPPGAAAEGGVPSPFASRSKPLLLQHCEGVSFTPDSSAGAAAGGRGAVAAKEGAAGGGGGAAGRGHIIMSKMAAAPLRHALRRSSLPAEARPAAVASSSCVVAAAPPLPIIIEASGTPSQAVVPSFPAILREPFFPLEMAGENRRHVRASSPRATAAAAAAAALQKEIRWFSLQESLHLQSSLHVPLAAAAAADALTVRAPAPAVATAAALSASNLLHKEASSSSRSGATSAVATAASATGGATGLEALAGCENIYFTTSAYKGNLALSGSALLLQRPSVEETRSSSSTREAADANAQLGGFTDRGASPPPSAACAWVKKPGASRTSSLGKAAAPAAPFTVTAAAGTRVSATSAAARSAAGIRGGLGSSLPAEGSRGRRWKITGSSSSAGVGIDSQKCRCRSYSMTASRLSTDKRSKEDSRCSRKGAVFSRLGGERKDSTTKRAAAGTAKAHQEQQQKTFNSLQMQEQPSKYGGSREEKQQQQLDRWSSLPQQKQQQQQQLCRRPSLSQQKKRQQQQSRRGAHRLEEQGEIVKTAGFVVQGTHVTSQPVDRAEERQQPRNPEQQQQHQLHKRLQQQERRKADGSNVCFANVCFAGVAEKKDRTVKKEEESRKGAAITDEDNSEEAEALLQRTLRRLRTRLLLSTSETDDSVASAHQHEKRRRRRHPTLGLQPLNSSSSGSSREPRRLATSSRRSSSSSAISTRQAKKRVSKVINRTSHLSRCSSTDTCELPVLFAKEKEVASVGEGASRRKGICEVKDALRGKEIKSHEENREDAVRYLTAGVRRVSAATRAPLTAAGAAGDSAKVKTSAANTKTPQLLIRSGQSNVETQALRRPQQLQEWVTREEGRRFSTEETISSRPADTAAREDVTADSHWRFRSSCDLAKRCNTCRSGRRRNSSSIDSSTKGSSSNSSSSSIKTNKRTNSSTERRSSGGSRSNYTPTTILRRLRWLLKKESSASNLSPPYDVPRQSRRRKKKKVAKKTTRLAAGSTCSSRARSQIRKRTAAKGGRSSRSSSSGSLGAGSGSLSRTENKKRGRTCSRSSSSSTGRSRSSSSSGEVETSTSAWERKLWKVRQRRDRVGQNAERRRWGQKRRGVGEVKEVRRSGDQGREEQNRRESGLSFRASSRTSNRRKREKKGKRRSRSSLSSSSGSASNNSGSDSSVSTRSDNAVLTVNTDSERSSCSSGRRKRQAFMKASGGRLGGGGKEEGGGRTADLSGRQSYSLRVEMMKKMAHSPAAEGRAVARNGADSGASDWRAAAPAGGRTADKTPEDRPSASAPAASAKNGEKPLPSLISLWLQYSAAGLDEPLQAQQPAPTGTRPQPPRSSGEASAARSEVKRLSDFSSSSSGSCSTSECSSSYRSSRTSRRRRNGKAGSSSGSSSVNHSFTSSKDSSNSINSNEMPSSSFPSGNGRFPFDIDPDKVIRRIKRRLRLPPSPRLGDRTQQQETRRKRHSLKGSNNSSSRHLWEDDAEPKQQGDDVRRGKHSRQEPRQLQQQQQQQQEQQQEQQPSSGLLFQKQWEQHRTQEAEHQQEEDEPLKQLREETAVSRADKKKDLKRGQELNRQRKQQQQETKKGTQESLGQPEPGQQKEERKCKEHSLSERFHEEGKFIGASLQQRDSRGTAGGIDDPSGPLHLSALCVDDSETTQQRQQKRPAATAPCREVKEELQREQVPQCQQQQKLQLEEEEHLAEAEEERLSMAEEEEEQQQQHPVQLLQAQSQPQEHGSQRLPQGLVEDVSKDQADCISNVAVTAANGGAAASSTDTRGAAALLRTSAALADTPPRAELAAAAAPAASLPPPLSPPSLPEDKDLCGGAEGAAAEARGEAPMATSEAPEAAGAFAAKRKTIALLSEDRDARDSEASHAPANIVSCAEEVSIQQLQHYKAVHKLEVLQMQEEEEEAAEKQAEVLRLQQKKDETRQQQQKHKVQQQQRQQQDRIEMQQPAQQQGDTAHQQRCEANPPLPQQENTQQQLLQHSEQQQQQRYMQEKDRQGKAQDVCGVGASEEGTCEKKAPSASQFAEILQVQDLLNINANDDFFTPQQQQLQDIPVQVIGSTSVTPFAAAVGLRFATMLPSPAVATVSSSPACPLSAEQRFPAGVAGGPAAGLEATAVFAAKKLATAPAAAGLLRADASAAAVAASVAADRSGTAAAGPSATTEAAGVNSSILLNTAAVAIERGAAPEAENPTAVLYTRVPSLTGPATYFTVNHEQPQSRGELAENSGFTRFAPAAAAAARGLTMGSYASSIGSFSLSSSSSGSAAKEGVDDSLKQSSSSSSNLDKSVSNSRIVDSACTFNSNLANSNNNKSDLHQASRLRPVSSGVNITERINRRTSEDAACRGECDPQGRVSRSKAEAAERGLPIRAAARRVLGMTAVRAEDGDASAKATAEETAENTEGRPPAATFGKRMTDYHSEEGAPEFPHAAADTGEGNISAAEPGAMKQSAAHLRMRLPLVGSRHKIENAVEALLKSVSSVETRAKSASACMQEQQQPLPATSSCRRSSGGYQSSRNDMLIVKGKKHKPLPKLAEGNPPEEVSPVAPSTSWAVAAAAESTSAVTCVSARAASPLWKAARTPCAACVPAAALAAEGEDSGENQPAISVPELALDRRLPPPEVLILLKKQQRQLLLPPATAKPKLSAERVADKFSFAAAGGEKLLSPLQEDHHKKEVRQQREEQLTEKQEAVEGEQQKPGCRRGRSKKRRRKIDFVQWRQHRQHPLQCDRRSLSSIGTAEGDCAAAEEGEERRIGSEIENLLLHVFVSMLTGSKEAERSLPVCNQNRAARANGVPANDTRRTSPSTSSAARHEELEAAVLKFKGAAARGVLQPRTRGFSHAAAAPTVLALVAAALAAADVSSAATTTASSSPFSTFLPAAAAAPHRAAGEKGELFRSAVSELRQLLLEKERKGDFHRYGLTDLSQQPSVFKSSKSFCRHWHERKIKAQQQPGIWTRKHEERNNTASPACAAVWGRSTAAAAATEEEEGKAEKQKNALKNPLFLRVAQGLPTAATQRDKATEAAPLHTAPGRKERERQITVEGRHAGNSALAKFFREWQLEEHLEAAVTENFQERGDLRGAAHAGEELPRGGNKEASGSRNHHHSNHSERRLCRIWRQRQSCKSTRADYETPCGKSSRSISSQQSSTSSAEVSCTREGQRSSDCTRSGCRNSRGVAREEVRWMGRRSSSKSEFFFNENVHGDSEKEEDSACIQQHAAWGSTPQGDSKRQCGQHFQRACPRLTHFHLPKQQQWQQRGSFPLYHGSRQSGADAGGVTRAAASGEQTPAGRPERIHCRLRCKQQRQQSRKPQHGGGSTRERIRSISWRHCGGKSPHVLSPWSHPLFKAEKENSSAQQQQYQHSVSPRGAEQQLLPGSRRQPVAQQLDELLPTEHELACRWREWGGCEIYEQQRSRLQALLRQALESRA